MMSKKKSLKKEIKRLKIEVNNHLLMLKLGALLTYAPLIEDKKQQWQNDVDEFLDYVNNAVASDKGIKL